MAGYESGTNRGNLLYWLGRRDSRNYYSFCESEYELTKALVDVGCKIGDIKLVTVHALQGAEKEIVLFSSVYSHSDEGTLFFDVDNKPNMLNVAVSRAKDSFILFGDTRVFNENNDTPSGVLKKNLNVVDFN